MHARTVLVAAICSTVLAGCSGESDRPGPRNAEPNDTPAQATPIPTDVLVGASMASPVDEDWYVFTVPADGAFVRIETFDPSGVTCSGADTYVELYDAGGNLVGSDDDGGLDYCSDLAGWQPAGTYYAAVWHAGLAPDAFGYSLRVTVTVWDGASEVEPNGTIATANGPFAADAVVAGALTSTGDVDYWAVQNVTGSSRTVYLETFEGGLGLCPSADSTLYVYDENGSALASNDDGGLNYCSYLAITIPAYTTRYVRVGGFAGDTFSYLLQIVFY